MHRLPADDQFAHTAPIPFLASVAPATPRLSVRPPMLAPPRHGPLPPHAPAAAAPTAPQTPAAAAPPPGAAPPPPPPRRCSGAGGVAQPPDQTSCRTQAPPDQCLAGVWADRERMVGCGRVRWSSLRSAHSHTRPGQKVRHAGCMDRPLPHLPHPPPTTNDRHLTLHLRPL